MSLKYFPIQAHNQLSLHEKHYTISIVILYLNLNLLSFNLCLLARGMYMNYLQTIHRYLFVIKLNGTGMWYLIILLDTDIYVFVWIKISVSHPISFLN
jgi:hypothetical protein